MESASSAAGLHLHHLFREEKWKLNEFEKGLTDWFQGFNARWEGEQKDVDPGQEVAHWPANKPQA